MLPLDDPRWTELKGGYKVPYDPRGAFARLRAGDDGAWDVLWNELHHQGDVDLASYAAVPHLLSIHRERDVPDWNFYALVSTVDLCRTERPNPVLPTWLEQGYLAAWRDVPVLGCRDLGRTNDATTVQSILGAIALAKGLRPLGKILLAFTCDELAEMIDSYDR